MRPAEPARPVVPEAIRPPVPVPVPTTERPSEPAPRPPPAERPAAVRVEETADTRWRELIGTLRREKKELLASAMAHARLLQLAPGLVRVGFAPLDGMHRRTAERGQKDAETALSQLLGAPTRLSIETVAADEAVSSVAEIDSEQTRQREARILRDSRECPEVLAALRIFKGTVEQIRLLEEEQPEEFTSETEDGEPAES